MDFHLILIAREMCAVTDRGMDNPITAMADAGTGVTIITTTIEIQHPITLSRASGGIAVVVAPPMVAGQVDPLLQVTETRVAAVLAAGAELEDIHPGHPVLLVAVDHLVEAPPVEEVMLVAVVESGDIRDVSNHRRAGIRYTYWTCSFLKLFLDKSILLQCEKDYLGMR